MGLIDADKLMLHLNDYALQEAPFKGEDGNIAVYDAIVQCMEIVKEQPTAYDLDKVMEQLKALKEEKTLGSHKVMIKETIEIVKGCGVDD